LAAHPAGNEPIIDLSHERELRPRSAAKNHAPTHRAGPAPTATRSLTLAEFLEAEQVAKSTFFKWKALGLAPATYKLPNGQIRIRRAAYEAWLASLEGRQAA
jgi:predicted DNA-binding transcriptional regulator AlpA